jgi:hypothetical protein
MFPPDFWDSVIYSGQLAFFYVFARTHICILYCAHIAGRKDSRLDRGVGAKPPKLAI